jgi:hypothetical protein
VKFPRQINRLITGRTFDLSTVHRQYLTLFEGVRHSLADNLKRRPGGHYEASPELFLALQQLLRQVADQHFTDASINAADLIAIALIRSAVLFRLPNNSRPEQLSRFRHLLATLRRQERGGFHKLVGFPIWRDDVFSFQSRTHKSELKLGFICGMERGGTEPFLAVEISGDPVRDLGRTLFGENNKLTRLAGQKEARKLWLAVLNKLYVMTGTISPKGGRPKEKYVVEGAFLKNICGLSWAESAAEVCPLNHKHNRDCGERLRKGVEQLNRRRTRKTSAQLTEHP